MWFIKTLISGFIYFSNVFQGVSHLVWVMHTEHAVTAGSQANLAFKHSCRVACASWICSKHSHQQPLFNLANVKANTGLFVNTHLMLV